MWKILFVTLILSGCVSTIPDGDGKYISKFFLLNIFSDDVSIENLAAQPDSYHGKKVTLTGYISIHSDGSFICSDKEFDVSDDKRCLNVLYSERLRNSSLDSFSEKPYVRLSGFFEEKDVVFFRNQQLNSEYIIPCMCVHRIWNVNSIELAKPN